MADDNEQSIDHKDRVRHQFGRTAQDYVTSERHRSGRDLDRLVELADPTPGDDALDIATGGGHTALALAPHVHHVVASDLTPEMLRAAEGFIHGEKGIENVSFEIAEAEHLPFDDASFDIVSCRIAPHHFDDVRAFCLEVARVLRPGGRFVLIDSLAPEDDELDAFINEVEWRRDTTHVRAYKLSEWRSFIEEAGLVIDAIEPFQRRYEYESWTGRSRMTEAAKDELEQLILTAPDRILEAFAIDIDEGAIQSLDDNKLLLRARKSAS
ncbi:MAG: methyltransferase domain-containing protein [Thermomicrobiales bacterium]